MKKLTITFSLLALAVAAMPLSASAHPAHASQQTVKVVHKHGAPAHHNRHKQKRQQIRFMRQNAGRLEKQEDRILHGLRDGSLTRKEAVRLINRQQRLERVYDRFSADGHISKQERKRFHRLAHQSSQRIFRLKHNHREAPRAVNRHPH